MSRSYSLLSLLLIILVIAISQCNGINFAITQANYYGTTVLIDGDNFDKINIPPDVITFVGMNCVKPVRNSINRVECELQQPYTQPTITFQMMVNGTLASGNGTFTLTNPYIFVDTLTPNVVSMNGNTKITLTGSFLGNASSMGTTVTLKNDSYSIDCLDVQYITDSVKISCTTGVPESEASLSVEVSNSETGYTQFPNDKVAVQFRAFSISTVEQNNDTVTIHGNYFDAYAGALEVTVGKGKTKNLLYSRTQCIFTIPPTMTNGVLILTDTTPGSSLVSQIGVIWKPIIRSFNTTPGNFTLKEADKMTIVTQMIENADFVTLSIGGQMINNMSFSNPLTVELPQLVGTVRIDLIVYSGNSSFRYTYPQPQLLGISSSTLNDIATIVIQGKYLYQSIAPTQVPVISGIVDKPLAFQVLPETTYFYLKMDLPQSARSGAFNISIGGQQSKSTTSLIPSLSSISSPPTGGGIITITGYYLSPTSFDNNNILDITIDGKACTNLTMVGTSFAPYTLTCLAPAGRGVATLHANNLMAVKNFTYQSTSITSVTSTVFNQPGDVTISGTNFAGNNLAVTIGYVPCTNPVVNVDYTQIVCNFASNVKVPLVVIVSGVPEKYLSLPVTISIGGQDVITEFKFIYSANSGTCATPCGNFGTCVSGECQCLEGYTGANCTIAVSNGVDVPLPSPDSTTVVLGSSSNNVEFNVAIAGIREMDATNGTIIKYVNIRDTLWNIVSTSSDSANNTYYVYNTSLPNISGFVITTEIAVFVNEHSVNFEGDTFNVPKNSIKYKITLSKWPFVTMNNYLQVLFQSSAGAQSICDGERLVNAKVGDSSINEKNSLRQMEIYQGSGLLRAFYSDRLLVDNRVTYSLVETVKPNDPSMAGLNSNGSQVLAVLTSVNVPSFAESAVIDPNFASLLLTDDNKSECGGDKERKWLIPVVVVVSVVGAAIIIVAAIIIIKKNHINLMRVNIKLRELRGKQ
ncbi:hypothetical protein SAMD00019534_095170 [Acytostelium subglobosum LB1]|uniref:hypothetical protein n=1 Tax=Acytostelium subglobosum LB1 TaxID=1410327 RepID=UPI0006450AA4|nr:hypothetical protein SAMD00019534_095170 [Acytostelium subglobosum LB1]GAM26342.1 hypothetical protein SAMD00019534_095170 [Acytostelium subglobosum LB1]|eukprot:XP_012750896.1 hypothetical protein SAMD00019534_095170 [Acytostelium subglobosum LB1]